MMEWKSVRMMKFPRYGNIAFMFQTTNQEVTWSGSNPWLPSNMAGKFTIMEDNGGLLRKIIQRHGIFCPASHVSHRLGIFLGLYCTAVTGCYWALQFHDTESEVVQDWSFHQQSTRGTQLWLGAQTTEMHCFIIFFHMEMHFEMPYSDPQKGRKSWFTTISTGFYNLFGCYKKHWYVQLGNVHAAPGVAPQQR